MTRTSKDEKLRRLKPSFLLVLICINNHNSLTCKHEISKMETYRLIEHEEYYNKGFEHYWIFFAKNQLIFKINLN